MIGRSPVRPQGLESSGYEEIVIETKVTQDYLVSNEPGEELLVDIARYSEHKDCKTLGCFVNDPTGRIRNAKGVIADLEEQSGKIKVRVFIER